MNRLSTADPVVAAPKVAVKPTSMFANLADDLAEVERIFRQAVERPRPGLEKLIAHLAHYKGKRLRPTLVLLTAQACGGIKPEHHTLGAVVEMIHTATLVHDDVLDIADVRRHVATVNALWGNQTSILLGDFLFTQAFYLSATVGDARVCRIIGEATNRVCEGELHQITQQGNLQLTEAEYFDIIDAKTAELTSCSCRLGAMFQGLHEDAVDAMADFGRHLGTAFQIADDLLDLVGEERTAGKSLGTDLEQCKLTLPLLRLLAGLSPEGRKQLEALLTSGGADRRATVVKRLHESGAIDQARRVAEGFVQRALSCLQLLPPSEWTTMLQQVAFRAVQRDR